MPVPWPDPWASAFNGTGADAVEMERRAQEPTVDLEYAEEAQGYSQIKPVDT
jgi:hypothetical protein